MSYITCTLCGETYREGTAVHCCRVVVPRGAVVPPPDSVIYPDTASELTAVRLASLEKRISDLEANISNMEQQLAATDRLLLSLSRGAVQTVEVIRMLHENMRISRELNEMTNSGITSDGSEV